MIHTPNPAGRRETAGTSTSAVTVMRSAPSFRSLRAAVLGAVLSIGAVAGTASAQTVSVQYEPSCGPSTLCGALQFNVANTTGALLELNSLTLFASGAAYAFAPIGPTTAGYSDDFGPFAAPATVSGDGREIFIDFAGGGFPFFLDAGNTGLIELQLASTPVLQGGAFTYSAALTNQQTIRGTVSVAGASVVPEPSTYVLMATGMGALGLVARRRRTS